MYYRKHAIEELGTNQWVIREVFVNSYGEFQYLTIHNTWLGVGYLGDTWFVQKFRTLDQAREYIDNLFNRERIEQAR
jgi:hypothetical protein